MLALAQTQPSPSPTRHTDSHPQLKNLSLEELANVEVTTYGKAPTDLLTTPAAMFVITSDDIRRSGVTTVADALRLAPGVEVGRLSSTTWAVGIRGVQSNFSKSVLVLIDGRNVYTPLFAGVYWDVQDLPLDDIDRIEVIRGPGGTIWGPNAANGVINIITKPASRTPGTMALAATGSQDHFIGVIQQGAASASFGYRVFARGFERGHEYHTDGINDDSWHQERFGTRLDFVSGRSNILAEVDVYKGDSPHILGSTPMDDQTAGGDVNLRWQRTSIGGSGFALQAYFDRTNRTGTSIGETRNTIDIDFVHHLPRWRQNAFSYGFGLRWSPYQIIAAFPLETLVPERSTDHVHTAFLQDEIRLGDKSSLTVGTKLQHNNFSGFDIQPSARFLWSPTASQSLWLGVTRAVTTPSDLEEDFLLQASAAPGVIIQLLGNHHFKTENLIGYEAGYRQLVSPRLYVDIAGFWNEYDHLQSFSPPALSVSGGNKYLTILYENQIAGATSGIEITPQVSVADWWKLNLAYSFMSSDFNASGPTSDISSTGSVSTYEGSSPKHTVSIQSIMNLPFQFQFDGWFRYASTLPAQKVNAHETMDLRLGRNLGKTLSLEIVGQNLFQPHHYEWGTGDPNQTLVGINRAVYAKITYKSKPNGWTHSPDQVDRH
jgi:iron complex outermembrane recepter protein